jgi:hypothetical protein
MDKSVFVSTLNGSLLLSFPVITICNVLVAKMFDHLNLVLFLIPIYMIKDEYVLLMLMYCTYVPVTFVPI